MNVYDLTFMHDQTSPLHYSLVPRPLPTRGEGPGDEATLHYYFLSMHKNIKTARVYS